MLPSKLTLTTYFDFVQTFLGNNETGERSKASLHNHQITWGERLVLEKTFYTKMTSGV